jgi:hypothetical protein
MCNPSSRTGSSPKSGAILECFRSQPSCLSSCHSTNGSRLGWLFETPLLCPHSATQCHMTEETDGHVDGLGFVNLECIQQHLVQTEKRIIVSQSVYHSHRFGSYSSLVVDRSECTVYLTLRTPLLTRSKLPYSCRNYECTPSM